VAKLVFGMNQSLDGYVDHTAFGPGPRLFRHFIGQTERLSGSIYGSKMYEVMRYWDEERDDWDAEEETFAKAWRRQPKWVVSNSLQSVGPNATLVAGDLEGAVREIKAAHDGDIDVAGTQLARSLGALGLIDEYRIYLHPVVLGGGTPFFRGARPPLRLVGHEMVDENVMRLVYVPA
jgi:dihydrofolate reductase